MAKGLVAKGGKPVPWHEDPIAVERVRIIEELWAEKVSERVMADIATAKLRELFPKAPKERTSVSLSVVGFDKDRIRQTWGQGAPTKAAIFAECDHVIRKAYRAFAKANANSIGSAAHLNTISRMLRFKAELAGLLVRKHEISVADAGQVRTIIDAVIVDEPTKDRLAHALLGMGEGMDEGALARLLPPELVPAVRVIDMDETADDAEEM